MPVAYPLLCDSPMNCMEPIEPRDMRSNTECLIQMPFGLLGFERYKAFALVTNPEEEPFLWLQVVEEPKLAFLVMSPFVVVPDYQPDISEEDAQALDLQNPADTLIFNIVTVRGAQQATVNLKGPIVLNRRTLVGKQIIPVNAPRLEVAHPLPLL
jgi:flagellar assembly factor FliW